ncbi:MAG TPA: ATP-binding protein [Gaiellaceae bacterium]|nr:ATP-binding protein [Gaiellaceae bacterium]
MEGRDLGFLAGGGELGERIRAFDWSKTPLGKPEGWPDSLRTAVRIMLASRQPIWIGWGEELTYLYNDPYKSIIGGKHPEMLGRPTRVVWSEIWDVIAPMLETALTGDEGTYVESQLLIMERYGYREETYYTFSYSPIPGDDGDAGGIICANTDDTQRVIGERRLGLLRELAARTAEALSWQEVCTRAAEALSIDRRDLPFVTMYLMSDDKTSFTLAGASGVEAGSPNAPLRIAVDSDRAERIVRAFGQKEILVVDGLQSFAAAPLPTDVWDEPPRQGAYVPLSAAVQGGGDGVLIVGLNPFRPFDDAYSDFLGLVGAQISASLATAQAYEGERRRAESLAELDRAKTVFFSNVSHEFRTPLTLMLGPLDDLLADPDSVSADARPVLEVLRRNALRLLRMVNTVLDFSRMSSDAVAHAFMRTDLTRLTAELAETFAPVLERSGIRFVREIEPLPAAVYIDGDAWDKIVLNLLSNAYKFTLTGEISVTLEPAGNVARLRVRDTGTGIPEDELPQLFERFHRVRNEQARTHEGTGIGLALVRELAELHGGTVSVESEVGTGTTFTVEIPLGAGHLDPDQVRDEWRETNRAAAAIAFAEEASRWAGLETDSGVETSELVEDGDASRRDRVVVVDDNEDMKDYIVRLLERHWRVDAYRNGLDALAAIRLDPPTLVVTDVMMPGLDGFGLLQALRDDPATAAIPVIVVSARAGEDSSVEGLDLGADDYLTKPFSARELVARVRANLELARLRAEAGRLSALEEVRSRVITTVSHELRTPVTAIYGAARTLQREDVLDPETRRELQAVIGVESERLARITSEILTTESLAAGLVPLERAPFDVRDVLTEAIRAAEARRADGIEFELDLPDEPVVVDTDRTRLQQVITNLLDNAIKYSPEGGDVLTSLAVVDGSATIVVADHGIGVPDDLRERLFERFYRVDPELTRGVSGSGLGLYICRQIMEALGGRIAVAANAPQGTRFTVSLPLT